MFPLNGANHFNHILSVTRVFDAEFKENKRKNDQLNGRFLKVVIIFVVPFVVSYISNQLELNFLFL